MAALKALASAGALSPEALSRALAHADAEVVKQALALGADRASVVQAAATLLGHPRWDVRVGAARVLLVSGGPDALPLLEAATAKETDPLAHEVLQAALQALSHR
jgi:HEAT repeat protein